MKPQILVPYDFSPASAKALAWAADLQRTVGALPVHVIQVVNTMPLVASPEMSTLPALSEKELSDLADELERAVHELETTATTEVIPAPSAGNCIVETARRVKADLIAMGTHGRGGLSRLVLGSVAEYVVRHAPCPVVTVRDSPAKAAHGLRVP